MVNENEYTMCKPCMSHCNECDYSNECTKCELGYGIYKNEDSHISCEKCIDDNCDICNYKLNSCSMCKEGFGVNKENGKCEKCQNRMCDSCIYDSTICLRYSEDYKLCEIGFGFNEEGKWKM